MNTYQETIAERKAMLSGARHKKNGSKSKKCSLPSDHLTPAQMRKLNGPVATYSINRPMPWHSFKQMPVDLQQEHIDYIQNRFGAGLATIGTEVFGISKSALGGHAAAHGLVNGATRSTRLRQDELEALRKWAAGEEGTPEPKPEAEPEENGGCVPDEKEPAAPEVNRRAPATLTRLAMELTGDLDGVLLAIAEAMQGMKRATVSITIADIEKEETT